MGISTVFLRFTLFRKDSSCVPMNAIMNTKNNGKRLMAAVAVLALIACAFMAVGVASEESDGALASQMTGDEFLKEANQGVITLDKNVELTSQVVLTESLTINLNGFTLSSADDVSNMFYNADKDVSTKPGTDNVDLVINGEKEGSAIDASQRIAYFKADECSLTITGGTYTAGDYGFIWYAANTQNPPANNITVSDITIDSAMATFWLSNRAIENAEFTNCKITSDFMGIYFGTVQKATITNCEIAVSGTDSDSAVEIKAGDVTFDGCTISATNYSVSGTVASGGNGLSESAITINNGYNDSAGTKAVNVIIKNSTITNSASNSKPVIVTSVNDNPIFFAWEGDVNDVAITGDKKDNITIGTISGDETTVEVGSVEKAKDLLSSESVDKVVLTGTVDVSSTELSVPKDKTLVIANDVTIKGTETNPIEVEVGGIIEVNTTSSDAKSFTIKGGNQTGEVTFTDVSGNFTITGGSVIVSGDFTGDIEGSGTVDVKLTGNISGDVNITWSGTGGNVIFDNATLSSNCTVTLNPNNITYSVNGELRVYGQILNSTAGTASMAGISIAVGGDDTVKAYASATIGNGIYFKGDGNIDLGSSMSTGYWSEDIASDMTWSQAQKTIIDGTMTIKSGYTLTVLGELVIDEGVTVYIEDGAKLKIGDGTSTAVGITVNGNIEVAQGGSFDVQNAKDVTITGELYSEGTVNITSKVTVKSGGSIFIDESYDETSPSKITANNGLTIEAGGSITISSEMTITEINNKGTVNLVDAILTGESKIIQAADGAVVNIDSITGAQGTSDTELIVTDSGLVFEKGKTSADDIKVGTDSNAFSVKLNYQKGISGIVITESVTSEKVGKDTKYSNAMYISGNVTAVNEAANATSADTTIEFTIRGDGRNDGGFYIGADDSLNLGAGVTMNVKTSTVSADSVSTLYVEGVLTATGTNSEIKYDTTGAGTVDIYVNGTVTTLNGKTAIKDNINAFHYTGTDTNKYEYYTTLNNALAASKDIEYIGDVSVMENATIPADTKVSAVSGATMTVGDADNRDVVLTVADGGILRNGKEITVNGTLVFENNKDGNKGNTILSDVQIDENPKMTFTNVYTALDNATSGKVEIRQDANVVLDSDIEVKEGVTLVIPDSATVTMYNGVTLTVNGTVENSGDIVNDMPMENGKYVVGEEPAGFNPMDGDETNTDAAKIVVNGAFKSMDYTAYEATTGQVGYYIPGAYYQIIDTEGSWYWITPVEDAAAVAADVDDGIAIYGEVTVGDVTFAGSTEEGADPVDITVNGKLTAGTITLDNATFTVPAIAGQYDGTVATAVGSISFVNVRNVIIADTADADDNEIMTLAGTPARADLKGADATVAVVSGNVAVVSGLTIETYVEDSNEDGIKSFTISDGATVTVMDANGTQGELRADNLTVNGTLVAIDGGNVNVTGTLTVRGTFTVAEKTDDNDAGAATVNKLLIGIAVNEDGEYGDASAGTVNADSIDKLASIVMSAESTFSGKQIESMKATEFYLEDALWITAYAGTSADRIVTAATGDDKDPTYGFKPADMTESMFVAWNDKDGKAITATTTVGQIDAVYANIDYNVYGVVITVDNSIGSIAIDGQLLTYDYTLGGYIIPGDNWLLTAGQHTVTYTLAAGYEGTPTLASNGTNVTVSGMNFTLSGDFLKSDDTLNLNYLTLGGATYSGNTVVIDGGNGGSSDMGLTDYLLIILVILIVVMAIIVAMRLMRS